VYTTPTWRDAPLKPITTNFGNSIHVIVISPPGELQALFHDGLWKSGHDCLLVFHSNCVCMVSGITKFYCQLDMTSSWFLRKGVLQAIFNYGFWKCDDDFVIVFHVYFVSGMLDIRDNDVLLQGRNDVMVISPPGSAPGKYSWLILKERPWLPHSVPY